MTYAANCDIIYKAELKELTANDAKEVRRPTKKAIQPTFLRAIHIIENDAELRNCKSFEELHDFCDANFLLFNLDDFQGAENSYFLLASNILIEYLDTYLKAKNESFSEERQILFDEFVKTRQMNSLSQIGRSYTYLNTLGKLPDCLFIKTNDNLSFTLCLDKKFKDVSPLIVRSENFHLLERFLFLHLYNQGVLNVFFAPVFLKNLARKINN